MGIQASPQGTYGAKIPGGKFLKKLFEPLAKWQISSYRRSGGSRIGRMLGYPVVLLTTTGAKSGLPRVATLGGFPDGDDAWLVVASNAGAATHPAWFINMVAHPEGIWLEVGKDKFKVRGESLDGPAREDAMRRIAALSPRYGKYQEKTDRRIPVVRLTRVS